MHLQTALCCSPHARVYVHSEHRSKVHVRAHMLVSIAIKRCPRVNAFSLRNIPVGRQCRSPFRLLSFMLARTHLRLAYISPQRNKLVGHFYRASSVFVEFIFSRSDLKVSSDNRLRTLLRERRQKEET